MGGKLGRSEARSLVLEGFVVLVSILVAFALDAWWDGVQSGRALAQGLSGVHSEMARNRDMIREEINSLQRIMAGSDAMLAILEAQSDRDVVVVSDTLAFLVSNWGPSLDLSFGALDALIVSGRLGEIDDLTLRTGLAGLKERAVDPVEDERIATGLLNDRLFPLLSPRVELGELARVDIEFFGAEDLAASPVPSYTTVPYPNSLEIRNTIRFRAAWIGSALNEFLRLQLHVDDLFGRLGAGP